MSDVARVANRLHPANGDGFSALEAAVLDEEVIAESGTHFSGATLQDAYVRKVALDNADFSGVTVYSGSTWEDANWWDAKCIPQALLDYLRNRDSHPLTEETKSKLVSNCHKAIPLLRRPFGTNTYTKNPG